MSVPIPAAANATQPALEIVRGPTQARLLKWADSTSPVNFTVGSHNG